MNVKSLQWSPQVLVPHPSSSRRQRCHVSNGGCGGGGHLVRRFPFKCDHPPILLQRSRSCGSALSTSNKFINRIATAVLFSFSNDEFPEEIDGNHDGNAIESCSGEESSDKIDGGDGEFNPLKLNRPVNLPDGEDHDSNNNAAESCSDEESSDEIDAHPLFLLTNFDVAKIFPEFEAQLQEHHERMKQLREEASDWRSIVEDAAWETGGEELVDPESRKQFISPFKRHLQTEALYLSKLSEEPNNRLLLTNYAEFLYQVARDHDRAEKYFLRALWAFGKDAIFEAETFRKYGEFLWKVRKNLLSAHLALYTAHRLDPNNTSIAAFYSHFRWITSRTNSRSNNFRILALSIIFISLFFSFLFYFRTHSLSNNYF